MAVIHAMIQAKTYLYPTHIHIPVLDLGPPPFCRRLCAPGVPQPRERIEGTAPRIALHALLKQPTRLFSRPRAIPARTTRARAIGGSRREREPDALGRWHEPCGRRGEHRGGDARGTDMREGGAEGHLYSLYDINMMLRGAGPDARRGFRSIGRLFRRIARCARRPLVALHPARLFGAGREGQGR